MVIGGTFRGSNVASGGPNNGVAKRATCGRNW